MWKCENMKTANSQRPIVCWILAAGFLITCTLLAGCYIGKTEPFTAGDTLDVRGMSLKSTCTTSVVNTTSGIETQCVTAFVGSSLIKATLPDSLAAGIYKLRVAQDGITQVATTKGG